MYKKIFSVILASSMILSSTAFAKLEFSEDEKYINGIYTEDFENYTTADDIIADDSLIKSHTGMAPQLGSINAGSVMVVNSVSGTNTEIHTNPALFEGDLNVIKFKVGADQAPKLNWKSASCVVISYTNASGNTTTDCILDFAYSVVRHKENGTTEKVICGFTPASQKLYDVEIKSSKVKKDGAYFYDITYIVEGNEYSVSFPTAEDGSMNIGFKSTSANKLYVDDIEAYSMVSVLPMVDIEGREDVCVKPSVEIEFSGAIDESTFVPQKISVGNLAVKAIETTGNNKYIVTIDGALKKDTEYGLDLSEVRDLNGLPLRKSIFNFKTAKTAVVFENGELINMSEDETENIIVYTPEYDENGFMTNKNANEYSVDGGDCVVVESENFIAVNDDLVPVAAGILLENAGVNEDKFGAEYDRDENDITVYGKTNAGLGGEKVFIKTENPDGTLNFAGMTETVSGGYFSISHPAVAESGTYGVLAVASGESFSKRIKVISKEDTREYKEDFESYADGSSIAKGSEVIAGDSKPGLENLGSNVMLAKSANVYTKSEIFAGSNSISMKIGADKPESKNNWSDSAGLLFSCTNESGVMADEYIVQLTYGMIRHLDPETGKEAKIIDASAGKLYGIDIKAVKTSREEEIDGVKKIKYYYDVTYTVNQKTFTTSYPTVKDGQMRLGFKPSGSNGIYVDDIKISSFDMIQPEVNIEKRDDVSVMPEIEITLSGKLDEETVGVQNIYVGNIYAETLEYIGDNKYKVTLSEPLKKNTTHSLDISGIIDFYGNPLAQSHFEFKTKDTAVVISDGKVVNTSLDEEENIIIITPSYKNDGTVALEEPLKFELAPKAEYPTGDKNIIVLTTGNKPADSNVFAENAGIKNDEFKAEFSSTTQKLTISGKTKSGAENEMIALVVTDKNGGFDYVATVKTEKGGYFSAEYVPSKISGTHLVFAKSMTEEFSGEVDIRLESDVYDLLEDINKKDADIGLILENYADVIAIKLDLYNEMEDKSFIISNIKDEIPYSDVEKLAADLQTLALASTIKDSEDKAAALAGYEYMVFGGEEEVLKIWNDLSEKDKNSALNIVLGNKLFAPDEFINGILSETILTMVYVTDKYIDVKNAIENHFEILGLDLEDYEKEGTPSSVAKNLCGKKWTKDEFAREFKRLVGALEDDNKGGGSSGGGASSSKGSIAMPQIAPSPMDVVTPESQKGFTDVDSSFWAKEAIDSLSERKILNGYEDGSFRPDGSITREEFVTVIARYLELKSDSECAFDDVAKSDWFYSYVAAAYANGIINGMSESTFGSGMPVSRQDAAVILYNIKKFEANGADISFTDNVSVSDYAIEAVKALFAKGIINGNPDGSLNPGGSLTRAQAAKMIFAYDKEVGR